MAYEVEWTLGAIEDLEKSTEYIARNSKIYADQFNLSVLDASFSLSTLFKRGRIVPEIGNPDIRELILGSYRLIYSIDKRGIKIMALIHGSRNFKKTWKRKNG